METNWNQFQASSTPFDRDLLFYNTFESILYYPYQWIDSYLHGNASPSSSSSFPFLALSIPFNPHVDADEYFCQLISYSFSPTVNEIYLEKWLEQPSSSSLLHYFNIHSRQGPLGLYGKIRQQTQFWSKFFWFNGSFLQCYRSKLECLVQNSLETRPTDGTSLCLALIEQSFDRIESVRPRGEIDPLIYEQILHDYQLKFQSEIHDEYQLRVQCRDEYEYALHLPIHQWEIQMKKILEERTMPAKEFYRLNNEQYQLLIIYLTRQLLEQLLDKTLLIEQIYKKRDRRSYRQWRKNLVEFHRNFILADKFYVYRDVTMPLMKEVFCIVLALDSHLQVEASANRTLFPYCQYPSITRQWNFFDIAKDLFQKRTFVQQQMPIEKFRQ